MGRTYLDFEQYIAAHLDCSIVELDVVGGGWRQKLPCPPYSFLSQLFLYIPYSHKERIQSFYSTARASLNGCTPFELALLLCDSYFVYYTIMVFF